LKGGINLAIKTNNFCTLLSNPDFFGKPVVFVLRGTTYYTINGFIREGSIEGNFIKIFSSPDGDEVRAVVRGRKIREAIVS
jgi:hypothetical protein